MKTLKPITIIMWSRGKNDHRDVASDVCTFTVLAEKPVEVAKAFDAYDFDRDEYETSLGEFVVTGCDLNKDDEYRPARYHGVTLVYASGKKREIYSDDNPFVT